MFKRSIQFPVVGRLTRGWGKWRGRLVVDQIAEPLDLVIEVTRSVRVEGFAEMAGLFAGSFGRLREEWAGELFETYQFYKKSDLEAGGLTEADFARHAVVRSREDIWGALR